MGQVNTGPAMLDIFFNAGTNFNVALDAANYHEGSQASGNIAFTLDRNSPAVSVYISIIGYERVMWRKRVRRGKSTRIITYRDHALC